MPMFRNIESVEYRTCKSCNQRQILLAFPKSKRKKNGGWYRRHKCNKCYGLIKKKYKHKKRSLFVYYKKNLNCVDCNYSLQTHPKTFTHTALEFHHNRSDKSHNVGNMVNRNGYAWETIKEEIKKCVVLCCRCHRERHANKDKDKKLKED